MKYVIEPGSIDCQSIGRVCRTIHASYVKYVKCAYSDLVEIFSNDIYDTKMNDEDDAKDPKET